MGGENAMSASSTDFNNTKKDIFVYPLEVIKSCRVHYTKCYMVRLHHNVPPLSFCIPI